MNRTVKPAFRPFACGCIPYVDTQSYEGWHQFGMQVPKGVKGLKPILVEDGTPGRDSLWCQCVVQPQVRARRATHGATPFIETDRLVAGPNCPAFEQIRPAVVAASPVEVAVQPATTVDRELYETALKVKQNTEASLLDDMLAGPKAQPEVVTVAAHPLTQVAPEQERRVRTITNRVAATEPRAPRQRAQRPNTNEIGAAPEGAMPLAEMMSKLAK